MRRVDVGAYAQQRKQIELYTRLKTQETEDIWGEWVKQQYMSISMQLAANKCVYNIKVKTIYRERDCSTY